MSQMLVMSVLVCAPNIDVITDVLDAGYAKDCITHLLLEDFCCAREAKIETFVLEQSNVCRKRAQCSRVGVQWDLVVPLI